MRFERKLSMGLALILATLLPALAVSLYSLSSMIHSQEELNDQFTRTLILAQTLKAEKTQQNAMMPLFVLSGENEYLVSLDKANRGFDEAMAQLSGMRLPQESRDALARIRDLQTNLRALEGPGIALRREGKGTDEVNAYFRERTGRLTDPIISELDGFVDATRMAYESRRALDDASFRSAFRLLVAGCAMSALFAIASTASLFRIVRRKRESDEGRDEDAQRALGVSTARKEAIVTVAHELKNPLSAILMATEHVLARNRLGADGKDRRMLEVVVASASAMNLIIMNVLDHAKIESSRLTLDRTWTPIGTLVERLASRFEVIATEKEIALSVDLPPDMPTLDVDAPRVEQVLSNLLGNAFKFTPREGRITVSARVDAGRCVLSVSDTGCGMTQEQAARAFDLYWQGEGSAGKGSGMGLSISRSIVEAHGGTLSVESVPGEGSTFRFALPVPAAAPETASGSGTAGASVAIGPAAVAHQAP